MAGEVVDGGKIIAQFLLDSSQVGSELNKTEKKIISWSARAKMFTSQLGEGMQRVGARMAEMGEKFTFLGAAIFTPLVAGMKSFADKGKEVQGKIDELVKKRNELAKQPFSFVQTGSINLQIQQLRIVNAEVLRAKSQQDLFINTVTRLKDEIFKLAWEALTPLINRLIINVSFFRAWIVQHRELVKNIIMIAVRVGALAATLGPLAAVIGRLILVFGAFIKTIGMLINPLGLFLVGATLLYTAFKDQLDPIITQFITTLTNLWKNWQTGATSTFDSLDKLGKALWNFFSKTFTVVGEVISKKLNEWTGGTWQATIDWLMDTLVGTMNKVRDAVVGAWDAITEAFDKAKGTLGEWFGTVKGWFDSAFMHSWWTDSMRKMAENANKYLSSTTASFTRAHGALAGALAGMQGVSLGAVPRIRQSIGYKSIPVGRMVGGGIQNSFIIQPIYPSTQELVDDLKTGITKITDKHVQKVFREANR